MGKISDYANVLKSKLTDLFVVYQRNDGELETKNATLEQLGDAICGEQVHSDLKTDNQTIIGGINENKDKVGDLSHLTTSDKSSLVGAVKEVVTNKSNVLVTEQFSSSFSVSANTDVAVNFDITKTGYTPLAVVFYTIANKDCLPHAIILTNSTTATFHISNVSSSAKSNISATATVLFVKN